MNINRVIAMTVAALAIAGFGGAIGYWLRPAAAPVATQASSPVAAQPSQQKPLYYQDPDGKPDYSPAPKKTADGRDYRPVFADSSGRIASGSTAQPAAAASTGKKRILYYRNPMGLPDTSPVPKKDAMGMDYVAVYAGEDQSGVVTVSPARMQMLGVMTASVELRSSLSRTIRATGTIEPDESKLAVVTTKFDTVVEKMLVSTTGAQVRAGQPLARIWIQTPETNMQIGPDVVTRQIDYVVALQDKDPEGISRAANVLRQYGMPESALAEIRRSGRATRSITITSPLSGAVIEKPAMQGMHFNTGDPLFKIADLSKVWLMADVQEQDLGGISVGQTARAILVAFPGRTFTGKVDFIYPALMMNTRTGRVRIVLPNGDGLLRQSMFATVNIDAKAASSAEVLVVPDSAVIDSGTSQVVLVARGQGRFEPRRVHVAAHGDGYTQILGGVARGEQVVVGANFLIDAESNLRAALSSFNSGLQ